MRHIDHPAQAGRYSKIGLGTWQFGSREWGYGGDYQHTEAGRIVRRALELGVTVFDTAEIYGLGRSERILGAALRDGMAATGIERSAVVVATKIFPVLPVAAVVAQRAVASAARLGLGCIDLYQVHAPNPVIRDSTTMRGMRALRDAGLITGVGVSNYPLARWRRADAALGSPVLSNQVRYSLVDRRPEAGILPFARQEQRIVLAYSPLGQGMLSGRYDADHRPTNSIRRMNPLFLPENLDRATELLTTLREVADAHHATSAQVALAWAVHHPSVVAIPGASSVAQVESNAAAAEIKLADDEYTALCDASDRFTPITGIATLPTMLRSARG
jgi:aryl-alcohol dehydrogenase-like predicted oxidoreductase